MESTGVDAVPESPPREARAPQWVASKKAADGVVGSTLAAGPGDPTPSEPDAHEARELPILVEDRFEVSADGDPDTTWRNAVEEVMKRADGGRHGTYDLLRQDKDLLYKSSEAEKRGLRNRYCGVQIICKRGGKPRVKPRVPNAEKQRQTRSEKAGCPFRVILRWPAQERGPRVTRADLTHNHEPPTRRRPEDGIMDPTFIAERGNEIEALTRLQWRPKQVYTYLTKDGKTLDHAGKMKVRNLMGKYRQELNIQKSTVNPTLEGHDAAASRRVTSDARVDPESAFADEGSPRLCPLEAGQEDPGDMREVDPGDVGAANYVDFVALGREMAQGSSTLHTREAARRVIRELRTRFVQAMEAEEATQRADGDAPATLFRSMAPAPRPTGGAPVDGEGIGAGGGQSSSPRAAASAGVTAEGRVVPARPPVRGMQLKTEGSGSVDAGGRVVLGRGAATRREEDSHRRQQDRSGSRDTRRHEDLGGDLSPGGWRRTGGFTDPPPPTRPRMNYPPKVVRLSSPPPWGGGDVVAPPSAGIEGSPTAAFHYARNEAHGTEGQHGWGARDARGPPASYPLGQASPRQRPSIIGPGARPSGAPCSEQRDNSPHLLLGPAAAMPFAYPFPGTAAHVKAGGEQLGVANSGRAAVGLAGLSATACGGTVPHSALAMNAAEGLASGSSHPSVPSPRAPFGTIPAASFAGAPRSPSKITYTERMKRSRIL